MSSNTVLPDAPDARGCGFFCLSVFFSLRWLFHNLEKASCTRWSGPSSSL